MATKLTSSHIGNLSRFFKDLKVFLNTLVQPKLRDIVPVTGTTYTHPVAETDSGATYSASNGSAQAITLPKTAPVGFTAKWWALGAGKVTFTAAAGGSLTSTTGGQNSIAAGGTVTLEVVANADGQSAAWRVSGSTAA